MLCWELIPLCQLWALLTSEMSRFFCCPNIYPLGGSYRWVSGQSLIHCVWVSHGTTVCPEAHVNSGFHKRHSGGNEVIGPLVWGWMASPRLLCGKSVKGEQGSLFTTGWRRGNKSGEENRKKKQYQCCSNMLIAKKKWEQLESTCAQSFNMNIKQKVCYYFMCIFPISSIVPHMLCSILKQYGNKEIIMV